MSSISKTILDAVGNTPLVELQHLPGADDARILVKVESVNVGGSIKTRTALNMIEAAEREGLLVPSSVVIEPTSGNQGIGLALVCAVKKYKCIIVMPDSVSPERRHILNLYGAEVVLVPDHDNIGECIDNCLKLAEEIKANTPNGFIPQQFSNPHNPEVHRRKTAIEILEQLGDETADAFCAGFGTGGTLTGIGSILKGKFPQLKVVAAEPENAAILAGGAIGSHLQQGIGDGLIPDNLDVDLIDENLIITDEEALQTSRDLALHEGLGVGISSGTNVACALRLAKRYGKGKTIITVLPDSYDRYYSTPLFIES